MIDGIDIANFGSFRNFRWDTVRNAKGEAMPFKTLNLLYGRNCSGKTTLSRILRCMETGTVHSNYAAPAFTVHTTTVPFTQAQIGTKQNVRVFNRDFVEQHLSFLRRGDGTIESFAVVGAENKEIEAQILAKTQELGSVESKSGLLFEEANANTAYATAKVAANDAAEALDALLTAKANNAPDGIKYRSREFGDEVVSYNKVRLKEDLRVVLAGGDYHLSEADARNLPIFVNEPSLPRQDARVEFVSNFPAITVAAPELITRKIAPSLAIQDLLNDAALQAWTQEGIHLHREKRETCGFCQQRLPSNLWQKLDAHFNQAANALSTDIAACQELIQQELRALEKAQPIPQASVYAVHRDELGRLNEDLYAHVLRHQATLRVLAESLRLRSQRIFDPQAAPATPNHGNDVASTGAAINALVAKSNTTTATVEDQKTKARRRLLLAEVAKFAADIRYAETLAASEELADRAKAMVEPLGQMWKRTFDLKTAIQLLRDQLRDEGAAAEHVNAFLQKHFGSQGLRLQPVQPDGVGALEFRVMRGAEIAHNLSDGECSLVAFCYFLARLEDTATRGTRPIVWIDDPISSLDSNHVFFLYSLIETQLARPVPDAHGVDVYRYEQIFISTHNLEFFKYLRKLDIPGKDKHHLRHYLVVKGDGGSRVERMPDYLVKYTTEFNFLFGELHTCVNPANQPNNLAAFYNFGANLRRMLEAYLYFRYPFADGHNTNEEFNKRIKLFFGNALGDDARVARMAHEGSHLMGAFDRAMLPVERDEISTVARIVLTKIRDADKVQYEALLASVGKTCPL